MPGKSATPRRYLGVSTPIGSLTGERNDSFQALASCCTLAFANPFAANGSTWVPYSASKLHQIARRTCGLRSAHSALQRSKMPRLGSTSTTWRGQSQYAVVGACAIRASDRSSKRRLGIASSGISGDGGRARIGLGWIATRGRVVPVRPAGTPRQRPLHCASRAVTRAAGSRREPIGLPDPSAA